MTEPPYIQPDNVLCGACLELPHWINIGFLPRCLHKACLDCIGVRFSKRQCPLCDDKWNEIHVNLPSSTGTCRISAATFTRTYMPLLILMKDGEISPRKVLLHSSSSLFYEASVLKPLYDLAIILEAYRTGSYQKLNRYYSDDAYMDLLDSPVLLYTLLQVLNGNKEGSTLLEQLALHIRQMKETIAQIKAQTTDLDVWTLLDASDVLAHPENMVVRGTYPCERYGLRLKANLKETCMHTYSHHTRDIVQALAKRQALVTLVEHFTQRYHPKYGDLMDDDRVDDDVRPSPPWETSPPPSSSAIPLFPVGLFRLRWAMLKGNVRLAVHYVTIMTAGDRPGVVRGIVPWDYKRLERRHIEQELLLFVAMYVQPSSTTLDLWRLIVSGCCPLAHIVSLLCRSPKSTFNLSVRKGYKGGTLHHPKGPPLFLLARQLKPDVCRRILLDRYINHEALNLGEDPVSPTRHALDAARERQTLFPHETWFSPLSVAMTALNVVLAAGYYPNWYTEMYSEEDYGDRDDDDMIRLESLDELVAYEMTLILERAVGNFNVNTSGNHGRHQQIVKPLFTLMKKHLTERREGAKEDEMRLDTTQYLQYHFLTNDKTPFPFLNWTTNRTLWGNTLYTVRPSGRQSVVPSYLAHIPERWKTEDALLRDDAKQVPLVNLVGSIIPLPLWKVYACPRVFGPDMWFARGGHGSLLAVWQHAMLKNCSGVVGYPQSFSLFRSRLNVEERRYEEERWFVYLVWSREEKKDNNGEEIAPDLLTSSDISVLLYILYVRWSLGLTTTLDSLRFDKNRRQFTFDILPKNKDIMYPDALCLGQQIPVSPMDVNTVAFVRALCVRDGLEEDQVLDALRTAGGPLLRSPSRFVAHFFSCVA